MKRRWMGMVLLVGILVGCGRGTASNAEPTTATPALPTAEAALVGLWYGPQMLVEYRADSTMQLNRTDYDVQLSWQITDGFLIATDTYWWGTVVTTSTYTITDQTLTYTPTTHLNPRTLQRFVGGNEITEVEAKTKHLQDFLWVPINTVPMASFAFEQTPTGLADMEYIPAPSEAELRRPVDFMDSMYRIDEGSIQWNADQSGNPEFAAFAALPTVTHVYEEYVTWSNRFGTTIYQRTDR